MFDKKIERFSGSSECFYYDRKTIAKCQESFCAISELIMHYLRHNSSSKSLALFSSFSISMCCARDRQFIKLVPQNRYVKQFFRIFFSSTISVYLRSFSWTSFLSILEAPILRGKIKTNETIFHKFHFANLPQRVVHCSSNYQIIHAFC